MTPATSTALKTNENNELPLTGVVCDLVVDLPEHFEDWKHELACRIQQKALERNFDPAYILAAAVLESGLNEDAEGDWNGQRYCSFGVLQYNECVHGKLLSTDEQVDLWIDNYIKYFNLTGEWQRGVQSWNAPALNEWWRTIYWSKYDTVLNEIT